MVAMMLLLLMYPAITLMLYRKKISSSWALVEQARKLLQGDLMHHLFRQAHGYTGKLKTGTWSRERIALPWNMSKEGSIIAGGIDVETGAHGNVIFVDDFVTQRDRDSKAEREKTKRAVYELQNIMNPTFLDSAGRQRHGWKVFTGTFWHPDDAWQAMPQPMVFPLGSFPLPSFTEEDRAERKRTMPPSLWACNYLLKHESDENLIYAEPKFADAPPYARWTMHLDPAFDGDCTTALAGAYHQPPLGRSSMDRIFRPLRMDKLDELIDEFGKRMRGEITEDAYKKGPVFAIGRAWPGNISELYDEILDYLYSLTPPGSAKCSVAELAIETNADKGLSLKALEDKQLERIRALESRKASKGGKIADKIISKLQLGYRFGIVGVHESHPKHARITHALCGVWTRLYFDERFEAEPTEASGGKSARLAALSQVTEYAEGVTPCDAIDALAGAILELPTGGVPDYGGE
jgi:hypothetical protein